MSKKKRRAAPRPAPPAPGRGRLWLIPVVAIPLVLVVMVLRANPSLPSAPELEAVSLEPPGTPAPSAQLEALLREKPARLPPQLEAATGAALREGRWPADPEAAAKALEAMRPLIERTRAALLAPGCLPREKAEPTAAEVSYLGLSRGLRLLGLGAVLEAQRGKPGEAARELLPVFDRLLALEKDCAPNLVAAMVLNMVLQSLGRGLGFALAQPGLDAATEAQIWTRLRSLEERPSPIPNALRWEASFLREVLQQPPVRHRGEKPPSWPIYDRADTVALGDRLARRNVWVVEQPLTSAAWGQRYPEVEHLEKLAQQPRPLLWLRYNSAGKVLLSIARVDHRRYALAWHRSRCLAAAQRARWVQDLRRRGRPPRAAPASAPALDPFTGQTFTGLEHRPVCGVPRRFLGGEQLARGDEPPPLPEAAQAPATPRDAAP